MSETEVVIDTPDAGSEFTGDEVDDGASSILVQEGDIAADYLERLLDIIDYDGDIDLDVENDRAIVAIVGDGLQALVGPQGQTLGALAKQTAQHVLDSGESVRMDPMNPFERKIVHDAVSAIEGVRSESEG